MALLLPLVFTLGIQALVLNTQTLLLCPKALAMTLPLALMVQI